MLLVVKQQLLQLLKPLELLLLLLLPLELQPEGQQPLLLPRRPDSCRPSCRACRGASCRALGLVKAGPRLPGRAALDRGRLARASPGREGGRGGVDHPVPGRLVGRAGKGGGVNDGGACEGGQGHS